MHDHADHTMGMMLVTTAMITGGIMVAAMLMSNSSRPSAGVGVFLVAGLPIMMLMIISVVVAYMVMGFILGTIARPPRF